MCVGGGARHRPKGLHAICTALITTLDSRSRNVDSTGSMDTRGQRIKPSSLHDEGAARGASMMCVRRGFYLHDVHSPNNAG